MENFEQKLQTWLENVAEECNKYGKELNLDYYPFQCSREALKENVDLLIMGANPGGNGTWRGDKNSQTLYNCGMGGENYFLIKEDKDGPYRQKVRKLFNSDKLMRVLSAAAVMNVVYFNTKGAKDLKYKHPACKFCVESTKELVYEILKPKAILIFGKDAWLGLGFTEKQRLENVILKSLDGKSALIFKIIHKGIVHYMVQHPSAASLNDHANIAMKRQNLEELL